MSELKKATTTKPVLDLIKNRWSARSFSDKKITDDEMHTIIEAGSWAFSAMNEQPWRFIYALKGTALFEKLFALLMAGNQPWCKNAGALMLVVGKKTYTASGHENYSMTHDIGAANMLMTLQGNSMGIFSHVLGGYHANQAATIFDLEDDLVPVVMMAFGHLDEAEKLEEPVRTRELTPRSR